MLFAIYLISALIDGFLFSVVTSMLIVTGIEKTGGDAGTPALMLIALMFICGLLSLYTASIMSWERNEQKKRIPVIVSAITFLALYLPFHIIGLYFSYGKLDFLAIPFMIMMFSSYIPFFRMTAQTLINVYEFFERKANAT